MARTSETADCRVLGEFVDDAGQARRESAPRDGRGTSDCVRELVTRIAREMAVPQYNLADVVEKVLSAVAPLVEERVRQELREIAETQRQSYNDSFTG